jgi:tritrans,polycis-undecaprenyl-diphosphate synthase [geranylgeranyl-diphosphate specific]
MTREKSSLMKNLHVGIIPDGNRRWAEQKNLPMRRGHKRGVEVTDKIFRHIIEKHPEIKEITIWAFSTENFQRSRFERMMIFRHIKKGLKNLGTDRQIHENRVKVNVFGCPFEEFPKNLGDAARQTMYITRDYGNRILNIGLGYGGRFEITRAAINFARWLKDRPLVKKVKEKTFEDFLSIRTPLDIVIRTGGQKRLSGFMLYQMAYAELFFSETLWPDFTAKEFDKIMSEFKSRKRRFGT